jgi:riboflavin synthase
MFTGIVEETGRVAALERGGEAARITVDADAVLAGTAHGDSICVNGVCLTVA